MTDNHGDERREYVAGALRREDLSAEPHVQFDQWLEAALALPVVDATAMTLATVDAGGAPSARIVLLKHHDLHGFVFYTDYESRKGQDLAGNPRAALLFYWQALDRQIRIQGTIDKVDAAQSDAYFASRPLDSQIAAAASHQSQTVSDRAALESEAHRYAARAPFARPRRWGGYRLVADEFEFWQGRAGRLHDRFRYRVEGAEWRLERLQP